MRALPTLGLHLAGQRLYDPAAGSFLQPDPIIADPHDPQLLNRYAYARNNPLRYTDAAGLSPVPVDPGAPSSWNDREAGNACISRAGTPWTDPLFDGTIVNARCLETPLGMRAMVPVPGTPFWQSAVVYAANPDPPAGAMTV